jgi:hypothetical protein
VLLLLAALALIGGLAFALWGGETPSDRAGTTVSPSPTASPSRSPTSSPSASPSSSPSAAPAPVDPLQDAVLALQGIVEEGLSDGTISDKAAGEIDKGLEEAVQKFADGDTEEALGKLSDLESKVDDLVKHDEIHHSQEQRIDRAIEDIAEQMVLASPAEDDDDD